MYLLPLFTPDTALRNTHFEHGTTLHADERHAYDILHKNTVRAKPIAGAQESILLIAGVPGIVLFR